MGVNGRIANQVRFILDSTGKILGYRNPVSDVDEELNAAALQAMVAGEGKAATAYLLSKSTKKLLIWGDSMATQNDATNSGYDYLGNAFIWKGLHVAGNPLDVIYVGGNSGNRTDQIIANFASQVAAQSPDYVLILAGTNDLIQGYGNDYAINGVMQMVALVESIGAVPILWCLTPGDTWAANGTNRSLWITHNASLRSLASAQGLPIIDGSAAFATAAGQPDAIASTNDGLHPNNLASEYLAPVVGAFFAQMPRRRLYSPLAAGNAVANPLLAGTGGTKQSGVTGSVPDGCTASGVAASVSSVYTRANGPGRWWQQVLTLNANQASVMYFSVATLATAGLAVGDVVRAVCDVEMDAGNSGLHSIRLVLQYVGGTPGSSNSTSDATNNGVGVVPGATYKRQLATAKKAIPAGTTSVNVYVIVQAQSSMGASCTVRVGAPSAIKVA